MGVTVVKKPAGSAAKSAPAKAGGGVPSWMQTGAAAQKTVEVEDAAAAAAEQERGKAWRWRLDEGEDATCTFLDGDINPETKLLDVPMYYEHTIKLAGRWQNFICTRNEEPCPLCEAGVKANFVAVMTVLDHRVTKSKDGKKTYTNQRKLFVAKRLSMKLLNKLAEMNGGLTGCTCAVSRTSDKEAAIGNLFNVLKKNSAEEIEASYGEAAVPFDYSEEIVYRTAADLAKLGIVGSSGFGGEADGDVGHKVSGDDL